MENSKKYFLFGTATIAGYKETVYLTKDGKLIKHVEKENLMLFDTLKDGYKYAESKNYNLAEFDKLSNF